MKALVTKIQAELGPISILVNNAGIGADRAVTEEIDEAMYDRMFDVHVKGTFFTTRAVLPGMKSYGSGAIVNISSIWGMVGHHFGSTYCAAKAAILGFTKSWAKELAAFQITVNTVSPGCESTRRWPDIRSASSLAMVRPRPEPCVSSAVKKGSKIRRWA